MATKKSKKSTIMMVAEPRARGDYGIKYPCYGEYKCPRCKREWSSNVAWRYDGQQCKSCKYFRRPWKTEPLNSFLCEDYESCEFQWNDKNPVSQCPRCGQQGMMFKTPWERRNFLEYTLAHILKSTDSEDDEPISNIVPKPHLRHLCERCQKSPAKDCQKNSTIVATQLLGRKQNSSGSGNGAVNKSRFHEFAETSKQSRAKNGKKNVPLLKKDAQLRTKPNHNLQEASASIKLAALIGICRNLRI